MIEKMKAAPTTNRGAENTYKYPLIIDWITFSGHFTTFEEIIEFLGLKNSGLEFEECPPRWFYKYSVTYDNHITLMMSQKEDYTRCCVNISGQGCRLIESFSCYSLLDLIKRVAALEDFNVSRIDIAQDVIDDNFSIDTLVRAYRNGNFTCRSKFSNLMQSQMTVLRVRLCTSVSKAVTVLSIYTIKGQSVVLLLRICLIGYVLKYVLGLSMLRASLISFLLMKM